MNSIIAKTLIIVGIAVLTSACQFAEIKITTTGGENDRNYVADDVDSSEMPPQDEESSEELVEITPVDPIAIEEGVLANIIGDPSGEIPPQDQDSNLNDEEPSEELVKIIPIDPTAKEEDGLTNIIEDPSSEIPPQDQDSISNDEEPNEELVKIIPVDPNAITIEEGGLAYIMEDQSVILTGFLAEGATVVEVGSGNLGGVVERLEGDQMRYTPAADFFGVEYFKYYVNNGNDQVSVETIIVEVEAVNDNPIVVGETFNAQEDESVVLEYLLFNDKDVDGDSLQISAVFQGENNGNVEILPNGNVKYTPAPDFFGEETFTYTVSDGNGGDTEGVVKMLVKAVNDVPIAKADLIAVSQNKETLFNLLNNDLGVGDGVQFSLISSPINGSVAISENGVASYIPNNDYFGTDEFVYQLTDIDGDTSFATVSLQIECAVNCTRVFKLTWDASISSGVTSYKVYVGEQPDALDQVIELGNVTQFEHTVFAKGEYYFAVSAVNSSAVESDLSVVQSSIF